MRVLFLCALGYVWNEWKCRKVVYGDDRDTKYELLFHNKEFIIFIKEMDECN